MISVSVLLVGSQAGSRLVVKRNDVLRGEKYLSDPIPICKYRERHRKKAAMSCNTYSSDRIHHCHLRANSRQCLPGHHHQQQNSTENTVSKYYKFRNLAAVYLWVSCAYVCISNIKLGMHACDLLSSRSQRNQTLQ